MKVYLVRHTSVDVAPGTCYGQTDVPLRASFQEEAEVCKKALQDTGMRFSRIYTSPLSRCTRLAAYCGFPEAERDERLKEMNMGEWEMQRFEEITFVDDDLTQTKESMQLFAEEVLPAFR